MASKDSSSLVAQNFVEEIDYNEIEKIEVSFHIIKDKEL